MMDGQASEAEAPYPAVAAVPQQMTMTMPVAHPNPHQEGAAAAGSPRQQLDEESSVFLSVVLEDGGSMSFCAYNEDDNTIYLETAAHVTASEVSELVQQVLGSVRPTLVLLPNKIVSNHELLTLLTTEPDAPFLEAEDDVDDNDDDDPSGAQSVGRALHANRSNHNGQGTGSIPYRIVKTASLDVRACRAAIMRLRVRSIERRQGRGSAGPHLRHHPQRQFPLAPTAASSARAVEVSHYHALASVIDFDSKTQVQAVGSLLSFLQTTVFQHVSGGQIPVNDVVQLQTSHYMKVHRDTLASLNIFATEHHPLASAKGHGGGSKEGCSLFSLLDRTRTHDGRRRLREWMTKPLLSVPDIRLRQDGVEMFLRPEFQSSAHKLAELLRRIGGATKILTRLQKAVAQPKDFVALPRAVAYALSVCEVLEQEFRFPLRQVVQNRTSSAAAAEGDLLQNPEHLAAHRHVTQDDPMTPNYEALQQADDEQRAEAYLDFLGYILDRCHMNVMEEVIGHMTTVVDEDATLESDHVVVVRGFSAELDEFKDTYDNLGGTLSVLCSSC